MDERDRRGRNAGDCEDPIHKLVVRGGGYGGYGGGDCSVVVDDVRTRHVGLDREERRQDSR